MLYLLCLPGCIYKQTSQLKGISYYDKYLKIVIFSNDFVFFIKGPQDVSEGNTNSERDVSADEGVSVTFETIKEDNTDGLRRRKESSKSEKDIVGNEYEGKIKKIVITSHFFSFLERELQIDFIYESVNQYFKKAKDCYIENINFERMFNT